ncbi:MAG: replication-associated recombination protein A [Chloroflexi bacterium]|nr:replication-associated recombination protein A [Chloroflexota bacterium]
MTLFEHRSRQELGSRAPLAARMRPRTFDEYVGQEHIIGRGTALRNSIQADTLPSIILWGPPGTGKTTLANLIANVTGSHFEQVSGVASGVADLRRIAGEARERLGMGGQSTILFVDEIHRFNKAQQDVILPYVEDGTLTLIGATTENPSFEVVSPLLSRARVFALESLSDEHVRRIVQSAASDDERGLADMRPHIPDTAINALVNLANGDARTALNALELAVSATSPDEDGTRHITVEVVEDAMQHRSLRHDKAGDLHYDTISAFIKSVRASDPDAAIYWLARMLEAGEDPLFIARRLVVLASEDIGMAAPQALTVAVAAQQAVHFIGLPEGRIPLAEATVYLATAPKSNTSYMALNKAMEDVQRTRNEPVPLHLRNAVTGLMRDMGYGDGYKYAHDYEGNFTPTQNLPDSLKNRRYYQPGTQGYERTVRERMERWWSDSRK